MKKGTIFALVGALIAVVTVLASCNPVTPSSTQPTTVIGTAKPTQTTTPPQPTGTTAPAPPVTTTAPPKTTAPSADVPQYGGSLSFMVSQTGGFDPANVLNFFPSWCLTYDALVAEDWSKGPSGSNTIPLASNYTPPAYFVGWLAESWEILDSKNIVYHLRQGVKFWNKAPVNGREFTADDVVFNFNRDVAAANSSWYKSTTTLTKIDKYTVKFTTVDPNPEIVKLGYSNFVIGAPEIAQQFGDMTDWRKIVGTGPYMPVDVVPESSITFNKNPDYFATDPLHKGNKLPYIDTLKALVIIDPATQDSAMRTGKVFGEGLTIERAQAMQKSNPELKSKRIFPANTYVLALRNDVKGTPLTDVRVRQALSMAIDRQAIIQGLYLGDATIQQWPVQPTIVDAYTSFEQLPANLKKLYEFHPDDAKKLLADAGYPNGFPITVEMLQGTYAGGTDLYSIVKNYWDAIGVKTTLQVDDATAFWSRVVGHTYKDTTPVAWGNGSPTGGIIANSTGYLYNYSVTADAKIDAALTDINATIDEAARMKKIKEIGLYIIEQQYYLNMPTPYGYAMWQPWVKGWNGEVAFGTLNGWYGSYRFMWLDQALKTKMGD